MDKDEALRLALRMCDEALPKFNWGASFLDANAIQLLNTVPAVIKAALAQPAQEDEEVCSHCGSYCHERDELDKAEREIVRLQKLAAQPAQEPVAWITPDGEGFRIRFSAPTNDVPLGWDALYTTPPQRPWVELTDDEEIADFLGEEFHTMTESEERFFRLGMQASKEKNT